MDILLVLTNSQRNFMINIYFKNVYNLDMSVNMFHNIDNQIQIKIAKDRSTYQKFAHISKIGAYDSRTCGWQNHTYLAVLSHSFWMIVCNVDELLSVQHASVKTAATFDELETRILYPRKRAVLKAAKPPYRIVSRNNNNIHFMQSSIKFYQ